MIKFKKAYSIKIVSILVSVIFLFTSTTYGLELSKKSHLRKNLDFSKPDAVSTRYLCVLLAASLVESSGKISSSLLENAKSRGIQIENDKEGNVWIYHEQDNIYIATYKDGQFGPKSKEQFNNRNNAEEESLPPRTDWAKVLTKISLKYLFNKTKTSLSNVFFVIIIPVCAVIFEAGHYLVNPFHTKRKTLKNFILVVSLLSMLLITSDTPNRLSIVSLLRDTSEKPQDVSLVKDIDEKSKIPYLGKDYFVFGSTVFSPDGKKLGFYSYQYPFRIIDIETRETLGHGNWSMAPKGKIYVYDLTGKAIKLEIDMDYIYRDDETGLIHVRTDDGKIVEADYIIGNPSSKESYITAMNGKKRALLKPACLAFTRLHDDFIVHAILDTESLSHYFFKQPTSMKLHKELKHAIDTFNPSDVSGKILKIELTRRLIGIEIELGLIPDIKIEKSEILEAYYKLENTSLEKLNNLEDSSVQGIIWNTIANIHPQCKLYYEATKRLGFDENIEILQESLKNLKEGFEEIGNLRYRYREILGISNEFNQTLKKLLSNFLLFNSLSTPKEILSYMKDMFKEDPMIRIIEGPYLRGSIIGEPIRMLVNRGLSEQAEKVSSLSLAHLEALTLEREGYETYLVIGNNLVGVENSKVPEFEYFVIFKEKSTNDWYVMETCDFISRKGLKIENGLYKISDVGNIEEELGLRAIYKIDAKELSLLPNSIKAYLTVKSTPPDYSLSFYSAFRVNLAREDRSLSAIKKAINYRNLELFKVITEKYRINVEFDITDQKRLAIAKSNFVKTVQLLPEKFVSGLKTLKFKEKIPSNSMIVTGVDSLGNLIYSKIKEAGGRVTGNGTIEQASLDLRVSIHEFGHNWEDATPQEIKDIFYNISWLKDGAGFRTIKKKLPDIFARPYGMTTYREDLATMVESYVTEGPLIRKRARMLMEKGEFDLAAKYLFVKYIIFKDFDGTFFEYEIDNNSPAITISEIEFVLENKYASSDISKFITKIKEILDTLAPSPIDSITPIETKIFHDVQEMHQILREKASNL